MVDLGIAFAWIAISAAGAKGLSAFGHVAAGNHAEAERGSRTGDGVLAHEDIYPIDLPPRRRSAKP
jgi:hypothetical protein